MHRSHRPGSRTLVAGIASVAAMATAMTALVTAPAAAAAAPTVTATVQSISPTALTLTRRQTDTVEISVRLVVPDGQRITYRKHGRKVSLPRLVDGASGARSLPRVVLTRVSGDRKDGVWQASIPVGAINRGGHRLSVQVCPASLNCASDGPVVRDLGESIQVTGTDWPVLADLTQDPARLPDGETRGASVTGSVVFSESGDPARRVDIALIRSPGEPQVIVDITGAKGRFTSPWPWPVDGSPRLLALNVAGTSWVVHDRAKLGIPASGFKVRTGRSDALVRPHEPWSISGTVSPAVGRFPLGKVKLQQRVGHRWRTIDRAGLERVAGSRRASFSFRHRFSDNGTVALRVFKAGARCGGPRCQIASDSSERIVVVVGSPEYLVERKLRKLGVPGGEVDGVIDVRARQALCAWRDMTGRKPNREGLTPSLARSILGAHRLPRPGSSDGLYINKTCQVLFQVVDGKYRRVVWVSTGQPGFDTPNGTGAIYRKREGFVESTLYPGAFMYYPMNFFPDRPAIALHGSVSNSYVEPHPASHGCIRVWRPQIRRIYAESPLGTKVKVYGSY